MKFDFWYENTKKDIARMDVFFYPDDGHYRGNLYNKNGDMIGDYVTTDSVEIENMFPGIFGN